MNDIKEKMSFPFEIAKEAKQKISNRNRVYFEKNNEVVALQCTTCKYIKDVKGFHKTKGHFAGISTICKECNKIKIRKYRHKKKIEKENEVEA